MSSTRKMTARRWNIAATDDRVGELADRLKISRIVAQVLLNRGVVAADEGRAFLQPTLSALHEPRLIPGLSQGAERLAAAIRDKRRVVVYGDYDVDGITGTAILWHAIKLLGGDVTAYLPHRIEEGYGLSVAAVRQLAAAGAQTIVTVDCGITAVEAARAAREAGVELIISDHHEWKESAADSDAGDANRLELPEAAAIVHPRLPSESTPYPNPHLCGAGVAFKLAWGVAQAVCGASRVDAKLRAFLVEAMALAALGTIADVVPLVGENRVLARFGLGGLKGTKLVGLRALIDSANLAGQNIDSYHVGFLLAPRLNAAGRMGHANLALEMLTTATPQRATEIADYLEEQNRHRQATERDILGRALTQIDDARLLERDCRALVVGGAGWHPGVIGIVASRLVDRFHRPAVVVGINKNEQGDIGQGSGRSVDGFHLAKALANVGHTLESHGGHEMAAGLKVRPEKYEDFRDAFIAHACASIDPQILVPRLRVDCDADLKQLTEPLIQELARLGPFGRGNPRPVLHCRDVALTAAPRRVGKTGDHLQLFLQQNGTTMKAIAFGAGDWADRLAAGTRINLAVEPTINDFNGYRNVELEVKDLQLADDGSTTPFVSESEIQRPASA
ncbi:MAG TPA: single-stranded-DNA-specific exonuclease RecJ [Tepidisphaeraceae bacterium]|jgi:single-stranded-DNA-specific exonuclease